MGDVKRKYYNEIDKDYWESRFLYRGYMPSRRLGSFVFPKAWNGKEWVTIEDLESWDMNIERISEEKYLKVLAEMGGKDLS